MRGKDMNILFSKPKKRCKVALKCTEIFNFTHNKRNTN